MTQGEWSREMQFTLPRPLRQHAISFEMQLRRTRELRGEMSRNRLSGHPRIRYVTICNVAQSTSDDSVRSNDPYLSAGETLVIGTVPLRAVSAPPSPEMCVAPPERFGRVSQGAPNHLDTPTGQPTGHPQMGHPQHRPRTLCVLLDDPAAAALSLRTHMQPADLQELLILLATAAADALRNRQKSG
jgi:hypothetical protein